MVRTEVQAIKPDTHRLAKLCVKLVSRGDISFTQAGAIIVACEHAVRRNSKVLPLGMLKELKELLR